MAIDIRKGAHTFGNGKSESETQFQSGGAYDIGGTAVVALHHKSRILFISGKAVVDVYEEAEEIWIWGGTLRLHAKCTVSQSGSTVFSNGTKSLVVVSKRGITHSLSGDRVLAFHEAQIHVARRQLPSVLILNANSI